MIISRLLEATPEELSQENFTKAVSSETSPVQKQNTLSTKNKVVRENRKNKTMGFPI